MSAVSPAQRAFLGQLSLGLGPTIMDVGANVGEWALAALDRWPRANIHCYEPQPNAFAELERVSGSRFKTHNLALSREGHTDAMMWVDADKDVLASFHKPGAFIPGAVRGAGVIEVAANTLDDELHHRGIERVDLLKLDTEGHEFTILHDAAQAGVLDPDRIRVIEWEYNQCAIAAHVFVHDFWCLLTGAGYQVGVLRDDGLVEPIRQYDMKLERVTPAREFVAASTITDDGKVVA